MIFHDREEAGGRLAERIIAYRDDPQVVIVALPRGGVVIGSVVAKRLRRPLDLVIPRKIGAPGNEEFAIGAVTEHGPAVWNEHERARVDSTWLEKEVEKERAEARRRREAYLANHPHQNLSGKIVIIVDDGLATGLTMKAAVAQVRAMQPKRIVVAVPVAPADTIEEMAKEVDECIVVTVPLFFGAIGAFYESFPQLTDEQVLQLLSSVPPDVC